MNYKEQSCNALELKASPNTFLAVTMEGLVGKSSYMIYSVNIYYGRKPEYSWRRRLIFGSEFTEPFHVILYSSKRESNKRSTSNPPRNSPRYIWNELPILRKKNERNCRGTNGQAIRTAQDEINLKATV